MLYHANARLAPGGYVGVDIFFVVSGFVISNLIRADLEGDGFSLRLFYRRRILRLFPALFATLLVSLIAGAWILSPIDLRELGRTAVSTVFFASNVDFMRLIGYFNNDAGMKPLLHMWSLAVEEQFYLAFPVLLMLVWKFSPRRVSALIVSVFLVSLGVELAVTRTSTQAAFYLPVSRAFEFAFGAILSWTSWRMPSSKSLREILALFGLILLAVAILGFRDTATFPGLAAIVPCLGTALLIHLGPSGTWVGRMLSLRIPRMLGDASYSLYLWHWPVVVFARHISVRPLNAWAIAAVLIIALALGLLSRQYVEQPVFRMQKNEWPVFRYAAGAMVALASVGVALYIGQGFPGRFSPQVRKLYAGSQDFNRLRPQCHGSDRHMIAYTKNCIFGDPGAVPDIAVWGDSYGAELTVALGELMRPAHRSAMQITVSACPPTIGFPTGRPLCLSHNRDTLERLSLDSRIRTVILAADYDVSYSGSWSDFVSGFTRSLQVLRAAGKRVGILFPIPVYEFDPPAGIAHLARTSQDLDTYSLPWAEFEQQSTDAGLVLQTKVAEYGAFAIRPADVLCDSAVCRPYDPAAGMLYFNRNHLSVTGARLVLSRFMSDLQPISAANREAVH